MRERSGRHLNHVRKHLCLPCNGELICSVATASQAHHIQYAQPRGLGIKTGDQWTIPICYLCHSDLHHFGNEPLWWKLKGIDAMEIARKLWEGNSNE